MYVKVFIRSKFSASKIECYSREHAKVRHILCCSSCTKDGSFLWHGGHNTTLIKSYSGRDGIKSFSTPFIWNVLNVNVEIWVFWWCQILFIRFIFITANYMKSNYRMIKCFIIQSNKWDKRDAGSKQTDKDSTNILSSSIRWIAKDCQIVQFNITK